ncbi:hypothetical protein GCM10011329_26300 [Stakelama pacifica]|nr:hypothetical protein GCM10011329_26300 [Stakelama pacifica]
MRVSALPLISLLLLSCQGRPETISYFEKVTGVELCQGATVRNLNAESPDRSPGFDSIYVVLVKMPSSCRSAFQQAIERRIGAACEQGKRCAGNTTEGDFIEIQPTSAGFRVTQST